MQTVRSLDQIPPLKSPIALSIGMFDGVHIGHQHLITELKKQGTPVVITFANHPAETLGRPVPTPICTLDERLKRLEKMGVALAIVLNFDQTLSLMRYEEFLQTIKAKLPFTTLILGHGSRFGAGAKGDETAIKSLQDKLNFKAIYLPKFEHNGEAVSSGRIRTLTQELKTLLGSL
jgi:riboflavin kinase/FMN adenylyltransferase